MRRLDVHLKSDDLFDTVMQFVEDADPLDHVCLTPDKDDQKYISILLRDETAQKLVDNLQDCLEDSEGWRLTISGVEASLPVEDEEEEDNPAEGSENALREELYERISNDAKLNREYLVFVALSTVVASIGLNSNGVAAVIGAMVIAPLLGPIIGFAFGVALGDEKLLWGGTKTLAMGIVLAILVSMGLSFFMPIDLQSQQLMTRAQVRLDGLALAMASGAAAALSIARGQGTVLVGVMVAAALLPPGAAVGLFLGAAEWPLASRALLLLLLNVASLILSALLVFRIRGIAPRKWIEQKNAKRALWINIALSVAFLGVVIFLIVYLDLGKTVSVG